MGETIGERIFPDLNYYSQKAIKERSDKKIRRFLSREPEEIFNSVCSACREKIGLDPHPIQVIGGMILAEGGNALEMQTGEGKTIAILFPACRWAKDGEKVHVVTANPYLAQRDVEWMGPVYESLGVSVGLILPQEESYVYRNGKLERATRREVYQQDVVYGDWSEFGFDWLRDRVRKPEERVQGPLQAVIIDEGDHVLLDEGTTPLVLSREVKFDCQEELGIDEQELREGVEWLLRAVAHLKKQEKYSGQLIKEDPFSGRVLTEAGLTALAWLSGEEVEGIKNTAALPPGWLAEGKIFDYPYLVSAALEAVFGLKKDVHYFVGPEGNILVSQTTGHPLFGRRFEGWLTPVLAIKENLPLSFQETTNRVGVQDYFRLYGKMVVLSGTLVPVARELEEIYGLETVVLPTDRPVIRKDNPDCWFSSKKEKIDFLVELVKKEHQKGRPILIGTVSIEESEQIAEILKKAGITTQVLNAKNDAEEASIIAKAGQKGVVTVATQMAGRGVDIKLGEGVAELGGLLVILPQPNKFKRVDEQVKGRAGRQGDPGESMTLVCPEDEIFEGLPPSQRKGNKVKDIQERNEQRAGDQRRVQAIFGEGLMLARKIWEEKNIPQERWPEFLGEMDTEWNAVLISIPLNQLLAVWLLRVKKICGKRRFDSYS